jgi:ribonuclease HII
MIFPTKKLEISLLKKYSSIIAIDEVGMGCLAGPVVVCAVMLDKKFFQKSHRNLDNVRDSKLLSAKQRETLAEELFHTPNFKYQICYCYPKTIDKLNIYQAARRAMKRSVSRITKQGLRNKKTRDTKFVIRNTIVLVDGPHKITDLSFDQLAIVKGDRKVFAIACASIIAKVYRDKMMMKYAKKYPNYGFEKHKGYGTKYHVAQLIALGPTRIHRRSFTPVGKLM